MSTARQKACELAATSDQSQSSNSISSGSIAGEISRSGRSSRSSTSRHCAILRNAALVLLLLPFQANLQADGASMALSATIGGPGNLVTQSNLAEATALTDPLEPLLMMILGAIAIGFQLRRKYKASQRIWQRIAPSYTDDASQLPLLEPQLPLSASVTWQQTR